MSADDWVKIIPPATVGIFLILLGVGVIIDRLKDGKREEDDE